MTPIIWFNRSSKGCYMDGLFFHFPNVQIHRLRDPDKGMYLATNICIFVSSIFVSMKPMTSTLLNLIKYTTTGYLRDCCSPLTFHVVTIIETGQRLTTTRLLDGLSITKSGSRLIYSLSFSGSS